MKHHIIVSGTGRAGTSFLIHLMTDLGLPTGIRDAYLEYNAAAKAGLERRIEHPQAPYIVKDPYLSDYLDRLLTERKVAIDHAIIPVRDLYSAAESRRDVSRRSKDRSFNGAVPGGLWDVYDPSQQEIVLAYKFYNLTYALVKHQIPTTYLLFPRLVQDSNYLYNNLKFMLGDIKEENFKEVFNKIARPDFVHNFLPAEKR